MTQPCPDCRGTGAKGGTALELCPECELAGPGPPVPEPALLAAHLDHRVPDVPRTGNGSARRARPATPAASCGAPSGSRSPSRRGSRTAPSYDWPDRAPPPGARACRRPLRPGPHRQLPVDPTGKGRTPTPRPACRSRRPSSAGSTYSDHHRAGAAQDPPGHPARGAIPDAGRGVPETARRLAGATSSSGSTSSCRRTSRPTRRSSCTRRCRARRRA